MSEAMPHTSGPEGSEEGPAPREELLRLLEAGETPLGEILRRRREALGLTAKEAALRLDVPSEHIAAVERDDYQRFAAPIYARSFLRRYAELLDLPVEPVLAGYERLAHPEPPPLKRVSLRAQVDAGHPGVRWTTYLLILLLLVLVGLWWWSMSRPAGSEEAMPQAGQPLVGQPLDNESP